MAASLAVMTLLEAIVFLVLASGRTEVGGESTLDSFCHDGESSVVGQVPSGIGSVEERGRVQSTEREGE